jgi:hypothetical protein
MQQRRCRACRRMFTPKAQAPGQCFCSDGRCQRERRRRWQKQKRQSDADYRENERRAQRAWAKHRPEYWQDYRQEHPEYAERNRRQQCGRDRRRREAEVAPRGLANGDASTWFLPFPSGTYELKPVLSDGSEMLANEDVWRVQIAVLPRS